MLIKVFKRIHSTSQPKMSCYVYSGFGEYADGDRMRKKKKELKQNNSQQNGFKQKSFIQRHGKANKYNEPHYLIIATS